MTSARRAGLALGVTIALGWAMGEAGAPLIGGGMGGDMFGPKPKPRPGAPTPHKGRWYRHVIGFSFWYPDGWTVKAQDDFLQLVPPKAASATAGLDEIYGITGESVAGQGIQTASDPRVIQHLDAAVRTLSPTMVRTGQPANLPTARGQGVMLEWRARSPTGAAVHARAYCAIIRSSGVALIALATPERLKARDGDLRRMFASFDFGQGARDHNLLGTWHLFATTSIGNFSAATAVRDENSWLAFKADGSFTRTHEYHMIVGHGEVWLEDKQRKVTAGTWNAGNAQLCMVSKNSDWSEYSYQLVRAADGIQLRLLSGRNGTIWKRVR